MQRTSIRRIIVASLIGAAAVLIAAIAWVGVRGILLVDTLMGLDQSRTALQHALDDRDVAGLHHAVLDIEARADTASSLTADPLWGAAELVPGVGRNGVAVRVLSEQLGLLANAAGALLATYEAASASPHPDGVDIELLRSLEEPLNTFGVRLGTAIEEVAPLRDEALLAPISDAISEFTALAESASDVIPGLATAMTIVPELLGASDERHILIVLQNTAELRSGGGLTGSFVLLSALDGDLRLEDQADSSQFRVQRQPVLTLPASTEELYGDVVGTLVQNVTMTPDFALSASLARQWWHTRSETEPDLVVAIDPIVLASIIGVVGDVELDDGRRLTADSAVDFLLVEPYLTLGHADQTIVQQEALRAVFEQLLANAIDPFAWAEALGRPLLDGRISIWSALDDEQNRIGSSIVGGMTSRLAAAGPNGVAVYFNDLTTAKLGTFLHAEIDPGSSTCADGTATLAVRVTLTSNVSSDASGYSKWMTGIANAWSPGDVATNVSVAAPTGAYFGGVWDGDVAVPSRNVIDGANPTSLAAIVLAPGESKTLEFRFVVEDEIEPVVVHTPMINDVVVSGYTPACP